MAMATRRSYKETDSKRSPKWEDDPIRHEECHTCGKKIPVPKKFSTIRVVHRCENQ